MLTFEQAIQDSQGRKKHLLLGNGFSIACRANVFTYRRLFEQADFSNLSASARHIFDALQTQDFERVIKALRDASQLISAYELVQPEVAELMSKDADDLREVLVTTIASTHPERPSDICEEEYAACRVFLAHFDNVYSLNYDLLLYWTQMHTEEGASPSSDDGFRTPENNPEADYVIWEPHQSHGQSTWFLHGALHIFDAGTSIQKYTWINTGVRLIEQIRTALNRDYYPLFVAEGSSEEKLVRIKHNDYLAKAYRSFSGITGSLFIYGHSLAENDEHFLKVIESRNKLGCVYVGIYGDPGSDENRKIISRAERMMINRESANNRRPLAVKFFDASTAHVWR
jgi:hypothetical protein